MNTLKNLSTTIHTPNSNKERPFSHKILTTKLINQL